MSKSLPGSTRLHGAAEDKESDSGDTPRDAHVAANN